MSAAKRSGYRSHPSPTATLDDLLNLGNSTVWAWIAMPRPTFFPVPLWWQAFEDERFVSRQFDPAVYPIALRCLDPSQRANA